MVLITSKSLITFFQISLFLIFSIIPSSFGEDINGVKCQERERLALVKFKSQLIDDYGHLSTWGNNDQEKVDCCKWTGVFCDNRTNHVVALDLGSPRDQYLDQTSPLRGNISQSLLELAYLNYLDLSFNDFNGIEIPKFICSLVKLQHLNLGDSNFGGLIPHCLGNLSKLLFLDLSENWLYDTNIDWLYGFQPLKYLDLSENNLQGVVIDDALGNLTSLSVIKMLHTSLEGKIPNALGKLMYLSTLELSQNNLEGKIPDALWNVTSLSFLDLGWNHLQAGMYDSADIMWKGIESEYEENLGLLTIIDLSSNNLIGEIPREVTSLIGLMALNLSKNNLVGSIPRDIDQLEMMNFLDLSENNLSGSIPFTLAQMDHLGVLDLSFNNLSGKIPWSNHLQTFDASIYVGNPGLCGPPLAQKPCPEDEVPTDHVDGTNNIECGNIFTSWEFYASMTLGFIVAFWGVTLTLFLNKWCRITIAKVLLVVEDWLR